MASGTELSSVNERLALIHSQLEQCWRGPVVTAHLEVPGREEDGKADTANLCFSNSVTGLLSKYASVLWQKIALWKYRGWR